VKDKTADYGKSLIGTTAANSATSFQLKDLISAIGSLDLTRDVLVSKMQRKNKTITGEALLANQYNLLNLFGAALPAFVLEAWLARVQRSSHEVFDKSLVERLPQNAIVYAFHGDTLPVLLSHQFLKSLSAVWIGYHGLLSYAGSFGLSQHQFPCFRYDRRLSLSIREQIQTEMTAKPDKKFYIFTDSGTPYFQVRKSLVHMAKSTHRPLVPVRHFATFRREFNGHQFPLPGTEIHTEIGTPISAAELNHLSETEFLAHLQQQIDALVRPTKVGAK
jgi:hypothetical protein